jgi:hypothetical protein
VRRLVVIVTLVGASAAISQWRPSPSTSPVVLTVAKMIPPLFTRPFAQGFPTPVAGCTSTPVSPAGKLAITMKNFSLIKSGGGEVSLLNGSATLDFAQNSGATVGNFVSGAVVPDGTYTQLKATMGSTLTIKGSVTCAGITYITSLNGTLTSPDPVGPASAAAEENITINNGVDQTFTLTLPSPVTVTAGNNKQIAMFFNNSAALELWNISPITGNAADRKILPKGDGPNKAE